VVLATPPLKLATVIIMNSPPNDHAWIFSGSDLQVHDLLVFEKPV
jgi:hypothetical protein